MDGMVTHLVAALLVALRLAPALAYGGPFTLLRIPVPVRVLLGLSLALWLVTARPDATIAAVKAGPALPGLAAGELFVGMAVAVCLRYGRRRSMRCRWGTAFWRAICRP